MHPFSRAGPVAPVTVPLKHCAALADSDEPLSARTATAVATATALACMRPPEFSLPISGHGVRPGLPTKRTPDPRNSFHSRRLKSASRPGEQQGMKIASRLDRSPQHVNEPVICLTIK